MVNNFEEEHPIAWYQTDDRDKPIEDQIGLFITTGGNGDWYIGTSPASNPNATVQAVRLCTSGGAVTLAPGLTWAIADAFKAIQAANEKKKYVRSSNHEDEQELNAWRRKFPNLCFDGRFDLMDNVESIWQEIYTLLEDISIAVDAVDQPSLIRLNQEYLEVLSNLDIELDCSMSLLQLKQDVKCGAVKVDDSLYSCISGLLSEASRIERGAEKKVTIMTYPADSVKEPKIVHPSNIAGLARDYNGDMAIPAPKFGVRVFKTIRKVFDYVKG